MKHMLKNHGIKIFLASLLAVVFILSVSAFNGGKPENTAPHQIELVAAGVAFHLADRPDKPNPTLTLKKGESVKLVIKNSEPGKILHCFTIGGLNVKTSGSLSAGESETLIFTPKKIGNFMYACLMHPNMAGKIVVE